MKIVFFNDKKIIVNIQNINTYLEGKTFRVFPQSDATTGLHIDAVNEDGSVKSIEEQRKLGIEQVQEESVEMSKEQELWQIDSQLEKVKETMIKLVAEEKLLGFVNEELEQTLKTQYQDLLLKKSLLQ